MDETMKQFQQSLVELEIEAERLLLARNQVVRLISCLMFCGRCEILLPLLFPCSKNIVIWQ